ncbi:MAG TPA: hypothetical protein VFY12_11985 [Arenimonas sp.]|nr:hypothetical protein [Arenimonas sp.]
MSARFYPRRFLARCLLGATLGLALPVTAADSELAAALARADAAFAASDWSGYAEVYTALTKRNPDNGDYWYRLGRAQQTLGQVEPALTAFAQASRSGTRVARSLAAMASLEAGRGHPEAAVGLFEQARAAKLVNAEQVLLGDPALSALLAEPRWSARLFPRLDANASRLQRWQTDLDFLDRRLRETHWQLFAQVEQARWESEVQRLRADLGQLEDWQIALRLMELARLGDSGHTHTLPPFQGDDTFHAADIRLQWFSDGLFVTAAPNENKSLVGRRVLRIGNAEPETVLAKVQALVPHDSASGLRAFSTLYLTMPEVLMHYGFASSRERLPLTLSDAGAGELSVELGATALSMPRLQAWLQYAEAPPQWALARNDGAAATPLWLRHAAQTFWIEPQLQAGLLYAQLNAVRDSEEESLAQFAARLQQTLASSESEGLILDLRHNRGGNGELLEPLLHALIATPKLHARGNFYVLIGGRTFSAAALLTGDLERQLDPLFVGERSGAGPTHVGEDNLILLPNSGLAVMAASRIFVRSFSDDQRRAIAPHLTAAPRFVDYRDNRDPVLAAVFEDRGLAFNASSPGAANIEGE